MNTMQLEMLGAHRNFKILAIWLAYNRMSRCSSLNGVAMPMPRTGIASSRRQKNTLLKIQYGTPYVRSSDALVDVFLQCVLDPVAVFARSKLH
jgi:hypothetical protein